MSHFTRVRTQLRNIETVKKALEDLGYKVEEGAVRGYAGQQANAELVVRLDGKFDMGFRREGSNVVMVADFWGLRMNREEFLQKLSQRYAYITVIEQAEQTGFQMMTEEVQQDGSIRLVMQRWS